ncbi:hypothetical protein L284_12830 [Novosphingobium lindaniclasticum LE124]|uniref:Uncharacterized protein n=1 Tax=Novosphingobium lindaniclasticum LE124 TaxID=1096930 RepID=T0HDY0_9SPHN|nr:hypothetical protein L284_12830 [Novosphingobium lindaniclasticum LE124]
MGEYASTAKADCLLDHAGEIGNRLKGDPAQAGRLEEPADFGMMAR